MKVTLIHAPLDDPTVPYHSNAYLAGHLEKNGYDDVTIRDTNAEFVNWCFRHNIVMDFYEEMDRRLSSLSKKNHLSFSDQDEYYRLWSSTRYPVTHLKNAIATLRDPESFLHWPSYCQSIQSINDYFGCLAALSYPCDILNFRVRSGGEFSIYNGQDLFNESLFERLCFPLTRFLEEELSLDRQFCDSDVIGVSIVYDHQMLYALHLIRFIRKRWPDKLLILGGTAISSYYKYLKNPNLFEQFLSVCDGIVVGEGETAICQILESGGDFTKKPIQNLVYRHPDGHMVRPPRIHFELVPALGKPKYEYDWDLYFSPHRLVNYSPTRGCYWNRCTFCDYGLNVDKPTSPWRETPIEKVVAELSDVCRTENVRYVYFAVDVMAPGYIERLAEAMIEAELDIRWSAEMRLEKIFSQKRCQRLAKSGAVSVSFGMESGNQRVLDLIDKGTKVSYMGETMRNFSESEIAVQLMAFTHFPSETASERLDTYTFIKENQDYWATGGLDRFVLTGKAIVARNPGKFGIKLKEVKNLDTDIYVAYEFDKHLFQNSFEENKNADGFAPKDILPLVPDRPWAGSTDTLHSMIFYDHYGRYFFKGHQANFDPHKAPNANDETINSFKDSHFDIEEIMNNRKLFREYIRTLRSQPEEPTYSRFQAYVAAQQSLARGHRISYVVTNRPRFDRRLQSLFKLMEHAATPL